TRPVPGRGVDDVSISGIEYDQPQSTGIKYLAIGPRVHLRPRLATISRFPQSLARRADEDRTRARGIRGDAHKAEVVRWTIGVRRHARWRDVLSRRGRRRGALRGLTRRVVRHLTARELGEVRLGLGRAGLRVSKILLRLVH